MRRRKERRRNLGLPEELTEEEEAVEAQKRAAEAEREAARRLPVKPVAQIARLRETLVQTKKASEPVRGLWCSCCGAPGSAPAAAAPTPVGSRRLSILRS